MSNTAKSTAKSAAKPKKLSAKELEAQLQRYRNRIDGVDAKLVSLLTERQEVVKQVGVLKADSGKGGSIIRPGREAEMVRKIAQQGSKELRGEILAHIWRQIIAAAINLEEATRVAVISPPQEREAYWLTREYFGMFTPIDEFPTDTDVIQAVLSRKTSVGVISIEEATHGQPWWRLLCDQEVRPSVFARLPFLRMAPSSKSPLLAMGYVDPESTGNDESLWVINVPDRIAWPQVQDVLAQQEVKFGVVDHYKEWNVPSYACYLILCDGFMSARSRRIQKAMKTVNAELEGANHPLAEAHFIGAYAKPMEFFDDE